jgi:hypothetical protein
MLSARFIAALTVASSVSLSGCAPLPDGDVVVGPPPFLPDAALGPQGRPRGGTFTLTLPSSASRFYNGSDATFAGTACFGPTPAECCHKQPPVAGRCAVNLNRTVSVYVPRAYADGDAAPLLVMADGPGYFAQVSYALDNLAGDAVRPLPPFVAVSVQNGGCDAIGSERGLEYDTMSDKYARFVDEEVLPAVLADAAIRAAYPRLAFSRDPDRRATFGCSSGGAVALTMAYFAPHLFRRVIAYSATLVDQQNHADQTGAFAAHPQGAWSYHSGQRLLVSQPNPALRVFHSGSEFDLGYNLSATPVDDPTPSANNTQGDPNAWTDGHHNWAVANNRTAAALREAGNHYRHVFALGAHHCDGPMILSTLGDTLAWLWQGVA